MFEESEGRESGEGGAYNEQSVTGIYVGITRVVQCISYSVSGAKGYTRIPTILRGLQDEWTPQKILAQAFAEKEAGSVTRKPVINSYWKNYRSLQCDCVDPR